MKVEDSSFINLEHEEIKLPFGHFYFFESIVVAELNEGIHFDWKRVKIVLELIVSYYGKGNKLVYISNRVNSYSIEPQLWGKYEKKYSLFISTGIVAYNKSGGLSVVLERVFAKESINRFRSLKEVMDWAIKLTKEK